MECDDDDGRRGQGGKSHEARSASRRRVVWYAVSYKLAVLCRLMVVLLCLACAFPNVMAYVSWVPSCLEYARTQSTRDPAGW